VVEYEEISGVEQGTKESLNNLSQVLQKFAVV
jgi:hypothetical protein